MDEATDFSPIQPACMKGLCAPAANSFFACGDFNQRITSWGTRSADDLKQVVPDVTFEPINISYRHSQQLNELAHRIALLSDPQVKKTELPEDVVNDGVKPVLVKGLVAKGALAGWLAARIGIEKVTGSMPSIAVLVNEEQVVPLAEALDAALAERSIRAVACTRGQSVGQDNDVRVFDIQHIKGMEFEAVFLSVSMSWRSGCPTCSTSISMLAQRGWRRSLASPSTAPLCRPQLHRWKARFSSAGLHERQGRLPMKMNKKPFPLATICSYEKRIDLTPDYQRPSAWSRKQKQLLLDTILRECHAPPVVLPGYNAGSA